MEHINGWDRSKIMRVAHIIKQNEGLSLGDAIRESWVRARAEKLIAIEKLIAPVTTPKEKTLKEIKEYDALLPRVYTMARRKVEKRKISEMKLKLDKILNKAM